MFKVTLAEVEGNAYSTVTKSLAYVTYRGVGLHKRSVKRAMQAARAALRRDKRSKGDEFPGGGTPVLAERRIERNGQTLVAVID